MEWQVQIGAVVGSVVGLSMIRYRRVLESKNRELQRSAAIGRSST